MQRFFIIHHELPQLTYRRELLWNFRFENEMRIDAFLKQNLKI